MANKEITAFDFFGDELELVDAKVRNDVNTINSQLGDIANKTIIENGKLYLAKADGTKIDTGTELSINSLFELESSEECNIPDISTASYMLNGTIGAGSVCAVDSNSNLLAEGDGSSTVTFNYLNGTATMIEPGVVDYDNYTK